MLLSPSEKEGERTVEVVPGWMWVKLSAWGHTYSSSFHPGFDSVPQNFPKFTQKDGKLESHMQSCTAGVARHRAPRCRRGSFRPFVMPPNAVCPSTSPSFCPREFSPSLEKMESSRGGGRRSFLPGDRANMTWQERK